MGFKLAHFSDVHLGPLPNRAAFANFSPKRLIGALSWAFNRRKKHLTEIAAALVEDIKNAKPDHVAFTGDLVNIAAITEFEQGASWLKKVGPSDWISFTPGNHDAYVNVPWKKGLGLFENYMSSDMKQDERFPFVRLRRNIALIGVDGAIPQGLSRAGGTVGREQRQRMREKLIALRERGFYRVVLIHHPPAPGLSHPFRSLSDAAELKIILQEEGAELVLHGHNHARSLSWLESPRGAIPIIGVPSASMIDDGKHESAAWNEYEIDRAKGHWQTHVSIRQWQGSKKTFKTVAQFELIKP